MIQIEYISINNKTLIKTYSDNNKYIRQNETGNEYVEAIDIPGKYTYTETEKEIENIVEKNNKNI